MIHKERVKDLIKKRQDHKSSLDDNRKVEEENEDGEEKWRISVWRRGRNFAGTNGKF